VILPEFTLANYKGGNAQMLPKQKIYVFVRKASTGTATTVQQKTTQKPQKPPVKYMDPIALVPLASDSSSSSTSRSTGPPAEEKLFFKVMSIEGSILVGAVVSEKKKGEFYLVLPVVIKNNVVTTPVSQLTPSQEIVIDKKLTQKYGTTRDKQFGPLIMQVNANSLDFIPASGNSCVNSNVISFKNSGTKKDYTCRYYFFDKDSVSHFVQQQKEKIQQARQIHKPPLYTNAVIAVGRTINTNVGNNVEYLAALLKGLNQDMLLQAMAINKTKERQNPPKSSSSGGWFGTKPTAQTTPKTPSL
jgi:hypothetical protein